MGKPRIILKPSPMIRKQVGQMMKLLGAWDQKSLKKDSYGVTNIKNPHPVQISGRPNFVEMVGGLSGKFISRRQIVLNRHFTEIVSDVLANSIDKQLADLGVNIRSIETKAWDKSIRIFYTTNKPFDQSIHDELLSLTTKLRLAVSERRLIGIVPRIYFIYDELAEADLNMKSIFDNLPEPIETSQESLVELKSKQVQRTHKYQDSRESSELKTQMFTSPPDMRNMSLGLDHETIYNEVAQKLERGRGQSGRQQSESSIAFLGAKLKEPLPPKEDDLDPVKRIMKMEAFMVKQKKKAQHLAKQKRMAELLHRDTYKWDFPQEEEQES